MYSAPFWMYSWYAIKSIKTIHLPSFTDFFKVTTPFFHHLRERFRSKTRIASTNSLTRVSMNLYLISWILTVISSQEMKKWSRDFENFSEAREMDCIDGFYDVPAVHSKRRAVHQKMHSAMFFLISNSSVKTYYAQTWTCFPESMKKVGISLKFVFVA